VDGSPRGHDDRGPDAPTTGWPHGHDEAAEGCVMAANRGVVYGGPGKVSVEDID
jgi:hypothetical protein